MVYPHWMIANLFVNKCPLFRTRTQKKYSVQNECTIQTIYGGWWICTKSPSHAGRRYSAAVLKL